MVFTNVYIKNFGENYDDKQLENVFSEFGKFTIAQSERILGVFSVIFISFRLYYSVPY